MNALPIYKVRHFPFSMVFFQVDVEMLTQLSLSLPSLLPTYIVKLDNNPLKEKTWTGHNITPSVLLLKKLYNST